MTDNNKEKAILNFGIYARFSSDNQNDKSSADQIYECREFIEKRNGRVVGVYKDDAITGSVRERPEYQRLLADIRDRKFDVLIAESTSRICRDQAEFHTLKKLLKHYDVSLSTLREGENLSGIELTFKAYMDEQYLEDLIAATRRGLKGRAREGIHIGRPPYGYSHLKEIDPLTGEMVKGVLVRDEERLAHVHRMFEMYSEGFSPQKIATILNDDGLKTADGNRWHGNSIRNILKNPIYAGKSIWNKRSVHKDPETGKPVFRENPKEEWVTTQNEELRVFSDNLWQSVQSRMEELNSKWKERYPDNHLTGKRRNKYMFTGLIECGECGGKYNITSKDRFSCSIHKVYKSCNNGRTVVRQTLENCVIDLLMDKIFTEENIDRFMDSYRENVEAMKDEINTDNKYTRQNIKKVEKKIDAVMAAIMRGVVTDTTQSCLEQLEQEKADMEARLLDHPVINIPDAQVIADFRAMVADIAGNLDNEEHYHKAMNIIRPLIDKIVIHPADKGSRAEVHGKLARTLDLRTDDDGSISFRVESDIAQQPYGNGAISESIIMVTFIPQQYAYRTKS